MDKDNVINFLDVKNGLKSGKEIPKSPQYRVLERIKQVLIEENCSMIVYASLEQIGDGTYQSAAHLEIVEVT